MDSKNRSKQNLRAELKVSQPNAIMPNVGMHQMQIETWKWQDTSHIRFTQAY